MDGRDELYCAVTMSPASNTHSTFITKLAVDDTLTNNTAIKLNWLVSDLNISHVEFRACYAVAGANDRKCSEWKNPPFYGHLFTNLFPYTKYNLSVDARTEAETETESHFLTAMTASSAPSAPVITEVKQVGDSVIVSWTRPARPNAEIRYNLVGNMEV